jgi:hypothetical protein
LLMLDCQEPHGKFPRQFAQESTSENFPYQSSI